LDEGVYPAGGEEAFVLDMIHDSLYFRNSFSWYTAMLGKKSSFIAIERKLKEMGFGRGSLRTTLFVQGNSTRWGIAWTFQPVSKRSPGKYAFADDYVAVTLSSTTERWKHLETRIQSNIKDFAVSIPTCDDPCGEVISRIKTFMQEQSLNYGTCETVSTKYISFTFTSQQENEVRCVQDVPHSNSPEDWIHPLTPVHGLPAQSPWDRAFLNHVDGPREWTMDFFLSSSDVVERSGFTLVTIHLCCYSNSQSNDEKLQSIVRKLEGEICRTNRRWRRRIQSPANVN
jgi:hypothetical protein